MTHDSPTSHSLLLLISWVKESWISELTVVVLGVELANDDLSLLDEVINVHLVREVGVKVVLEVLKIVHNVLNDLVSSNSWEGESTVIELPGVDGWKFSSELIGNLTSVVVVDLVESSGEHVHLVVQLGSRDLET